MTQAANLAAILDSTGNATFTSVSGNVTIGGYLSTSSTFTYKNRIINGAMIIDQRNNGASVSGTGQYSVDRWYTSRVASATATFQRSTTAPTGFINSILNTVGTGASPSSSDTASIQQVIEGFNLSDMAFGTSSAVAFTLSFWTRSSVTGTFGVGFRNGNTNRSYVGSYTINLPNTFEYKTIIVPGDTTGTWATDNTAGLYVNFDLGVGSSLSATAGSWQAGNFYGLSGGTKLQATSGATFYLTGVQLEKGPLATSFDIRPYLKELQFCQRYLPAVRCNGSSALEIIGSGFRASTTQGHCTFVLPVTPRTKPTGLQAVTAANYTVSDGSGTQACSALVFGNSNTNAVTLLFTTTATTAGFGCMLSFGTGATTSDTILLNGCDF